MDAKTYSQTLFGRVVDFKDVAADQAEYAKVFASGSPALEKLLRNLWNRGIQTIACGNGYDERHENFSLTAEQNIQDRYDTYLNTHGLAKWVMNRHKDDYIPKHHAYVSIDAETVSNPNKFIRAIKSAMKPYRKDCHFEITRAQTAGKDAININMNIPRNQECTFHKLRDMSFEDVLKSTLPSPTAFDKFFDAINASVVIMAKKEGHGHANLSNNASEYQNMEFGKVVSSFEAIKADKQGYADVFSEGSPALKNLLLHMWDNDIETFACCVGHIGTPYYTRDTINGPEEIDIDTYCKHLNSPEYHCNVQKSTGYFLVKVDGNSDKIQALGDDLKQRLAEVKPALPCRVMFGPPGTIGINMEHEYVSQAEKERVFSQLSDALSQTLGIPEQNKKHELISDFANTKPIVPERKPSFDSIVANAQTRHDAQLKTHSQKPQLRHEPFIPEH